MQKPKIRETELSSVCKAKNYWKSLVQAHALLFAFYEWAESTEINEASERLIFGAIKTIMPCVEGDRSDCQPLTTTTAFGFGQ